MYPGKGNFHPGNFTRPPIPSHNSQLLGQVSSVPGVYLQPNSPLPSAIPGNLNQAIAQQQHQIANLQSVLNTIQQVKHDGTPTTTNTFIQQQHLPMPGSNRHTGPNFANITSNPQHGSVYASVVSSTHIGSNYANLPVSLPQPSLYGSSGNSSLSSIERPGFTSMVRDQYTQDNSKYLGKNQQRFPYINPIWNKSLQKSTSAVGVLKTGYEAKQTDSVQDKKGGDDFWKCCEICNITFPDEKHFQVHCNGRLHSEKLKELVKSKQNFRTLLESDDNFSSKVVQPKHVYENEGMVSDVQSLLNDDEIGGNKTISCRICNIERFRSQVTFGNHIKTFNHNQKYLRLQSTLGFEKFYVEYGAMPFGGDDSIPDERVDLLNHLELMIYRSGFINKMECRVCRIKCGTMTVWKQHINGKKHLKKCAEIMNQEGFDKYMSQFGDIPIPDKERFEGILEAYRKEAIKSGKPIPSMSKSSTSVGSNVNESSEWTKVKEVLNTFVILPDNIDDVFALESSQNQTKSLEEMSPDDINKARLKFQLKGLLPQTQYMPIKEQMETLETYAPRNIDIKPTKNMSHLHSELQKQLLGAEIVPVDFRQDKQKHIKRDESREKEIEVLSGYTSQKEYIQSLTKPSRVDDDTDLFQRKGERSSRYSSCKPETHQDDIDNYKISSRSGDKMQCETSSFKEIPSFQKSSHDKLNSQETKYHKSFEEKRNVCSRSFSPHKRKRHISDRDYHASKRYSGRKKQDDRSRYGTDEHKAGKNSSKSRDRSPYSPRNNRNYSSDLHQKLHSYVQSKDTSQNTEGRRYRNPNKSLEREDKEQRYDSGRHYSDDRNSQNILLHLEPSNENESKVSLHRYSSNDHETITRGNLREEKQNLKRKHNNVDDFSNYYGHDQNIKTRRRSAGTEHNKARDLREVIQERRKDDYRYANDLRIKLSQKRQGEREVETKLSSHDPNIATDDSIVIEVGHEDHVDCDYREVFVPDDVDKDLRYSLANKEDTDDRYRVGILPDKPIFSESFDEDMREKSPRKHDNYVSRDYGNYYTEKDQDLRETKHRYKEQHLEKDIDIELRHGLSDSFDEHSKSFEHRGRHRYDKESASGIYHQESEAERHDRHRYDRKPATGIYHEESDAERHDRHRYDREPATGIYHEESKAERHGRHRYNKKIATGIYPEESESEHHARHRYDKEIATGKYHEESEAERHGRHRYDKEIATGKYHEESEAEHRGRHRYNKEIATGKYHEKLEAEHRGRHRYDQESVTGIYHEESDVEHHSRHRYDKESAVEIYHKKSEAEGSGWHRYKREHATGIYHEESEAKKYYRHMDHEIHVDKQQERRQDQHFDESNNPIELSYYDFDPSDRKHHKYDEHHLRKSRDFEREQEVANYSKESRRQRYSDIDRDSIYCTDYSYRSSHRDVDDHERMRNISDHTEVDRLQHVVQEKLIDISQEESGKLQVAVDIFSETLNEFIFMLHGAETAAYENHEDPLQNMTYEEKEAVLQVQQMAGIKDIGVAANAMRVFNQMDPIVIQTIGQLGPDAIQDILSGRSSALHLLPNYNDIVSGITQGRIKPEEFQDTMRRYGFRGKDKKRRKAWAKKL